MSSPSDLFEKPEPERRIVVVNSVVRSCAAYTYVTSVFDVRKLQGGKEATGYLLNTANAWKCLYKASLNVLA